MSTDNFSVHHDDCERQEPDWMPLSDLPDEVESMDDLDHCECWTLFDSLAETEARLIGGGDKRPTVARYETYVEDGTIYVGTGDGPLEVGSLDSALDAVGGPSWTIRYSPEAKERHPGMDTSDEGLTVDVVDMIHAMTHSERFVETLAAQPLAGGGDDISPRLGLFVGKLLENLESGVD